MSSRSHSLNAYEVALTSAVGDASLSFPVEAVAGLSVPLYLVIDPDDPVNREYIKVTSINGLNLEVGSLANRGLAGTTGGVPLAHDLGAKVRAVAVSQWLDDIFNDVEELEIWDSTHDASVNPHSAAGFLQESDTDALYLKLSGGTLTGDLILSGDPDTALKAATKQYVDASTAGAWFPLIFSSGEGDAEVTAALTAFRWIAPRDCTLVSGTVTAGDAPTGDDLICDALLNGGPTMFSGAKPTVLDGERDGVKVAATTTAVAEGDVITGHVVQIGSTTSGGNVTFSLEMEGA